MPTDVRRVMAAAHDEANLTIDDVCRACDGISPSNAWSYLVTAVLHEPDGPYLRLVPPSLVEALRRLPPDSMDMPLRHLAAQLACPEDVQADASFFSMLRVARIAMRSAVPITRQDARCDRAQTD